MRCDRVTAAAAGLLAVVAGLANPGLAQQPAPGATAGPAAGQAQSPAQPASDRLADSDRLRIFVVAAAVGVADGGGRGRGATRPCEITSIVRAFCSAPDGSARDGCEITDGQLGAPGTNLFVEPYRTDILQSCGISSLAPVTGFGITYICRGAWSSQTVGQLTRHDRPAAFTQNNQARQSPPWRIIMLCR